MPNLGAPELIIIAIIVIALFGWKRLPDMARSLGRSARVFKSEVDEMKKDGKSPSEASQSTVAGDVVEGEAQRGPPRRKPRPGPRRLAPRRRRPALLRRVRTPTGSAAIVL